MEPEQIKNFYRMFKNSPQKSNSEKAQITLLHTLAISFKSTNLFAMSGQCPVHRPPDKNSRQELASLV